MSIFDYARNKIRKKYAIQLTLFDDKESIKRREYLEKHEIFDIDWYEEKSKQGLVDAIIYRFKAFWQVQTGDEKFLIGVCIAVMALSLLCFCFWIPDTPLNIIILKISEGFSLCFAILSVIWLCRWIRNRCEKRRVFYVIWALYFILQCQIVSSFANVVGMLQAIVFMQKDNHKWARSKWWLVLFLGLQFAVCIYGFRAWHDLFPLFGSIFGALAYFVIDEKTYRYFAILNIGFWLANSISKMPATVLALICDSTGTVSGLIGIARFYKRQKTDAEKQTDNTDNDKKIEDLEKDLVV
jgi:hypothetical protein